MCINYSRTINLFTELDAYPLPSIESIVNEVAKWKRISTLDLKSAVVRNDPFDRNCGGSTGGGWRRMNPRRGMNPRRRISVNSSAEDLGEFLDRVKSSANSSAGANSSVGVKSKKVKSKKVKCKEIKSKEV